MNTPLKDKILFSVSENKKLYLTAIIVLLLGIVFGAVNGTASFIEGEDGNYLTEFVSAYNIHGIIPSEVFRQAVFLNVRIFIIIWLSGMLLWLLPLNIIAISSKGFGLGYTVAYLSCAGGIKGFILSLLTLSLQNFILLPSILVYSVSQAAYAQERKKLYKRPSAYKQKSRLIKKELILFLAMLSIALLCSAIDAYVIPTIISPICGSFA